MEKRKRMKNQSTSKFHKRKSQIKFTNKMGLSYKNNNVKNNKTPPGTKTPALH